jgi:hypothetical protein
MLRMGANAIRPLPNTLLTAKGRKAASVTSKPSE